MYLWDVKTRKEVGRVGDHRAPVWSVAFSPGKGELLATGSSDRTARG